MTVVEAIFELRSTPTYKLEQKTWNAVHTIISHAEKEPITPEEQEIISKIKMPIKALHEFLCHSQPDKNNGLAFVTVYDGTQFNDEIFVAMLAKAFNFTYSQKGR